MTKVKATLRRNVEVFECTEVVPLKYGLKLLVAEKPTLLDEFISPIDPNALDEVIEPIVHEYRIHKIRDNGETRWLAFKDHGVDDALSKMECELANLLHQNESIARKLRIARDMTFWERLRFLFHGNLDLGGSNEKSHG